MIGSGEGPAGQESPEPVAGTPLGWRGPERDQSLPHQPVLIETRGVVSISCNCLLIEKPIGSGGFSGHEPIGPVADRYDTQRLYNDPTSHRTPFAFKDEIHYKDVEPWSQ